MRGQGSVGGMIMATSNMGSMANVGMGGGGLVVNSLKQQTLTPGGAMMMNPNSIQPSNQQGMHHPGHQGNMNNITGSLNNISNNPMGGMQVSLFLISNYEFRTQSSFEICS